MPRTTKIFRPPLTDLEHAVMGSIWRRKKATAEQVREDLGTRYPLKESTVRTLLARLERKGHVRHRVSGRAYEYSSTEPPRALAIRVVQQLIQQFCAGSVEQLITGMVDSKVLTSRQLRELADAIERSKQHGTAKD